VTESGKGSAGSAHSRPKVDLERVRALAQLALLPLSEDRVLALAESLGAAEREHTALRGLPLGLEPHMVFDPRWD
jgi:hypothetical protein